MKKTNMPDVEVEEPRKSKSQVKRELQALQALGKELVGLSPGQLVSMPISDDLRDAVIVAKALKHGPLNRQLKYIRGFMPHEDVAAIRAALIKLRGK